MLRIGRSIDTILYRHRLMTGYALIGESLSNLKGESYVYVCKANQPEVHRTRQARKELGARRPQARDDYHPSYL